MGQKATTGEISEILSWLGRQASNRMRSETGRLIHVLQARALSDARAIAAELARDLDLFGTSETRSTISQIGDLLQSDAVFSDCDRLSYLLLELEQQLSVMPLPVSEAEVTQKPGRALRRVAAADLELQRADRG